MDKSLPEITNFQPKKRVFKRDLEFEEEEAEKEKIRKKMEKEQKKMMLNESQHTQVDYVETKKTEPILVEEEKKEESPYKMKHKTKSVTKKALKLEQDGWNFISEHQSKLSLLFEHHDSIAKSIFENNIKSGIIKAENKKFNRSVSVMAKQKQPQNLNIDF